MKYIILVAFVAVILLAIIIPLENQLDDCRFECNHLQARLTQCQELSDYIPAMENILNPVQLAELKALSEMIKQEKYKDFERYEKPLLNEKELEKVKNNT
jgi:hypothetical protein